MKKTINSGGKSATIGEKNALKSATNYLSVKPFSKYGLANLLKFDGYTEGEANYAAENCGANWEEQAVKSARNYIGAMPFSKRGLIKQLKFEGYTQKQAEYGVEKAYK